MRAATEADFTAICGLMPTQNELYRVYPRGSFPLTVEQVRHLAEVRKALTVVTTNGQIVGFANLYDFDNQRAFIGNVVIDKMCRGQGHGKRLVEYMRDLAFSNYNLHEIHISVFSDNTSAVLLYSSLGFVPYAIEKRINYAGERTALLHMKFSKTDHIKD